MAGSWSEQGERHEISWFTDTDREKNETRVRAVVVRRPGRPVSTSAPQFAAWPLDGNWSGSVGTGWGQTFYSAERAVVAIHEREFPLPSDGRALLLLVDERTSTGDPTFETHAVDSPSVQRVTHGRNETPDERRARMRAHFGAERMVWGRWLDEQPLIRAFLVD